MSSSTNDLQKLVIKEFTERFGSAPSYVSRAPGRVNIIGEHTDYNDGFVFPAAINRATYIAGKLRDDDLISVKSLDYHDEVTFSLDRLREESLPKYTRYVRGVPWILREEGYKLRGMNLAIVSDVPGGGGFSSSAAVEVAMFEIASALLDINLDQRQKALLGVEVEHRFVGVPCGVMDQMISALGQEDHALLIDCRSLAATPVPLPAGVTLMTLDTGVRRQLAGSEYGKRRAQCEEAARLLGVKALRDVTPEQLAANIDKLPAVNARRATHVVYEDVRTLAAVSALRRQDLKTVGWLLNESHASLRDLYEVSIHELDIMADLAQEVEGCYGARMMGGGFGGPVIALVEDSAVQRLTDEVGRAYQAATGLEPAIYAMKAGPGSSVERIS